MTWITLLQPKKIVFGSGCITQAAVDMVSAAVERVFLVTSPPILSLLEPLTAALKEQHIALEVYSQIASEPSVQLFKDVCNRAREMNPDLVLGVGGGSPLDVAKLVAALHNSEQGLEEIIGVDRLATRQTRLVCLPTTSGTGSEVSPNALLLDEEIENKRAVVSSYLVPDAAYIDPELTVSLPAETTATTGLDALTHSIEAYANRFAHIAVDLYALQSIRLIAENLAIAVANGDNLEAREKMALGSLYGGLCLGPVNTAAVHALAYPLGGEFHVPHGLSNALLLPHVTEFNIPASPGRYADIAEALGVQRASSDMETAQRGLVRLRRLIEDCGIKLSLSELGIGEEAIPRMAQSAMTITRLLKNNPRDLTLEDAEAIYHSAL